MTLSQYPSQRSRRCSCLVGSVFGLGPGFIASTIVCPRLDLGSSSSISTGFVMPLREDWAIFCHSGSGLVGRMWSHKEKYLEVQSGIEPRPQGGQTERYICSLTELSWLNLDQVTQAQFQVCASLSDFSHLKLGSQQKGFNFWGGG